MNIKVICLNLWEGGRLFEGIVDFLKQEDADILLLQEVCNGSDPALPEQYHSIRRLTEALPYEYYDYAPAMIDVIPEGKFENGNAIFSKFPIQPHERLFFSEPFRERDAKNPAEIPTTPRNLQHVTATVPGNGGVTLELFNFQGVWDLDGDNYSPHRKQMSDVILHAIEGKMNVILAGDTNAKPTNQAMVAIESQLHSVFGHELTTSFNMKQKDNPGYATAVVDMIFVSPTIAIVEKHCPDVNISDHLPLVATLRV